MLLKRKPIEVPNDDPFKYDLIGRKKNANTLTTLVKSIDEPFVIAINSGWGTGKTTFLKMWEKSLQTQHNITCLYFNAWENDFSEDPLLSFVGEIEASNLTSVLRGQAKKRASTALTKARKIASSISRRAIPVAAKVATAGIIDLDSITEDAISGLAERLVQERFDKYESDKHQLEEFRNTLKSIAACFSTPEEQFNRPLVFLIDELDRCRPSYAIALLERLKHLFAVEGIVYVVALDKSQLSESIKSVYGSNMNAQGYLGRFFDLEYRLSNPTHQTLIAELFNQFDLANYFHNRHHRYRHDELSQVRDTFAALSEATTLSLRDIDQCFTQLILILRTSAPIEYLAPELLIALIILRKSDPDLYKRFASGADDSHLQVLKLFCRTATGKKFLNSNYGIALKAFLDTGFLNTEELRNKYDNLLAEKNKPPIEDHQEITLSIIKEQFNFIQKGVIPHFLEKIELMDDFIGTP